MRNADERLLALPWERPLGAWDPSSFVPVSVGPSRNLVRFVDGDEGRYALKELDSRWAEREWRVLRRCADVGIPAVTAIGIVERTDGNSVIVTRAVAGVDSYREILGGGDHEEGLERLLDALTLLLVELHRAGIYWGDATLSNTLLARDGDGIVAMLVDGETGEVYPSGLTDSRREEDLALCIERVAHGLVDLTIARGERDREEAMIAAAERIGERYRAIWSELRDEVTIESGDMHALSRRIRRIESLGFIVREIELRATEGSFSLRLSIGRRRALGERLERLTGLRVHERQAELLLHDLELHRAWLTALRGRQVDLPEAAVHWRAERLEPMLARLAGLGGPSADRLQLYCELLDRKSSASDEAGHDIGLQAAFDDWLSTRAASETR